MIYVILIILIIIILFRILFGTFQSITFLLMHPIRFIRATVGDLIATVQNLKNKTIPEYYSGIILIGGLFGTGKTANQVDYALSLKKTYSNVRLFSNVTLYGIDYTHFEYLEQILEPCPDGEFRVFLCDEFGSLFNSRNYKNCEFTEGEYLTMLNQIRKERKLLLITTQRYHMLDKVFRQVAKEWWECHKYWRFLVVYKYDPLDMEQSCDTSVRPLSVFPTVKFLDTRISDYYDTHELVKSFKRNLTLVSSDTLDTSPVTFDNSIFKRKNKNK